MQMRGVAPGETVRADGSLPQGLPGQYGFAFTIRYSTIARALIKVPAKWSSSNGELVASSIEGIPEFYALHLDLRTRAPGEAARASRGLDAESRA